MSAPPSDRIHITGASGSGQTTLGAALAERFGYRHFDADSYYWIPTDPPFTTPREVEDRRRLLGADLKAHPRWALSGSLMVWGDPFMPLFDLVVFLYLPHDIRMARLRARESARFGAETIAPGGHLHQHHAEFMSWAEKYDTAGDEQRSLYLHNRWLASLTCPVLRIEGDLTLDERIARITDFLAPR
jgi:adenylate kinase family enzyme